MEQEREEYATHCFVKPLQRLTEKSIYWQKNPFFAGKSIFFKENPFFERKSIFDRKNHFLSEKSIYWQKINFLPEKSTFCLHLEGCTCSDACQVESAISHLTNLSWQFVLSSGLLPGPHLTTTSFPEADRQVRIFSWSTSQRLKIRSTISFVWGGVCRKSQVFWQKNPDFRQKNTDFVQKNPDFRQKNSFFVTKNETMDFSIKKLFFPAQKIGFFAKKKDSSAKNWDLKDFQ